MRPNTLICILLLAQLPLVARADWNTLAVTHPGWYYNQSEDEMGRGTLYSARLFSINQVDFSFPYESGQPGLLVVACRMPKDGIQVMLMAKGQFASTYTYNYVTVRFDKGPLQNFQIANATNGVNDTILINDVASFVRNLRSSSHVKIEATFYHDGARVFEFDTQGLRAGDWLK
jgi:hypothetical protein